MTGMTGAEVCKRAAELIAGDREAQHGDKLRNFTNIAALWNAYLVTRPAHKDLDAADVAHMMILMKVARTQSGSLNTDDYVDAAGYAGCAAQVAQQLYG